MNWLAGMTLINILRDVSTIVGPNSEAWRRVLSCAEDPFDRHAGHTTPRLHKRPQIKYIISEWTYLSSASGTPHQCPMWPLTNRLTAFIKLRCTFSMPGITADPGSSFYLIDRTLWAWLKNCIFCVQGAQGGANEIIQRHPRVSDGVNWLWYTLRIKVSDACTSIRPSSTLHWLHCPVCKFSDSLLVIYISFIDPAPLQCVLRRWMVASISRTNIIVLHPPNSPLVLLARIWLWS